jgi:5-methylcytosine-specific restriction endonuclease McrA
MKRSTLNHLSKKKCHQNMLIISGSNDPICVDRCSDCKFPHYYSAKKRTVINPISKKKQKEIQGEILIRKQLWERAKGCCELCGRPNSQVLGGLHPHEWKHRSQGGRMSLENSSLLCNTCQGIHGHNLKIKEY